MPITGLYTLNDFQYPEKDAVLAKIKLNGQHEIFKGHFPGRPVLPGVCLLNIITDLLTEATKEKQFLKSADFVKFINLVQPEINTYIYVQLSKISETEEGLKLEASAFFENTVFLKFKGVFGKLIL